MVPAPCKLHVSLFLQRPGRTLKVDAEGEEENNRPSAE